MGSTLRPIDLEAGFGAVLLSLLSTVLFGALLISAGHPGEAALMAFPSFLVGFLARAAGICHRRNPQAIMLLGFLAFFAYQGIVSVVQTGWASA